MNYTIKHVILRAHLFIDYYLHVELALLRCLYSLSKSNIFDMKAFCEKSDHVLRALSTFSHLSWEQFTELTNARKADAVLIFLKEKEYIKYSDHEIMITEKGRQFIASSSFAQERDRTSGSLYQ